jgi:hypothetical protein
MSPGTPPTQHSRPLTHSNTHTHIHPSIHPSIHTYVHTRTQAQQQIRMMSHRCKGTRGRRTNHPRRNWSHSSVPRWLDKRGPSCSHSWYKMAVTRYLTIQADIDWWPRTCGEDHNTRHKCNRDNTHTNSNSDETHSESDSHHHFRVGRTRTSHSFGYWYNFYNQFPNRACPTRYTSVVSWPIGCQHIFVSPRDRLSHTQG